MYLLISISFKAIAVTDKYGGNGLPNVQVTGSTTVLKLKSCNILREHWPPEQVCW